MQGDCILHKILNARALNLLLKLPSSLLPGPEVNLHNVGSHGPERSSFFVLNNKAEIKGTLEEYKESYLL